LTKIHGGDIYLYNKNLIDFSVNINPFGVTDNIIKYIKNNLSKIVNYPDIECVNLRKAISEKEKIDKDYIVCGNGAAELIFNIVLALKPKKVFLIAPSFAEYERAADVIRAEKVYYFLEESQNFNINKNILDNINDSIDMLFLCNPNNPTGGCLKKELVLEIADKCEYCGVFLVIDESFIDFVIDNEKYSIIKYIQKYDNILLLRSFTKMYAIPGVRIGYCVCKNKKIIEKIYNCRQPWNVSTIAQSAGIAALKEETLPFKTREYIKQEKMFITKMFYNINIKFFHSYTNYILFKEKKELNKRLLEYNILIRNCDNYRGLGEGFYRIAIKKHSENLKLIIALKEILKQ